MSKTRRRPTNKKGRNSTPGQFLPIPYVMAKSDAFRSLEGSSLKVWIELRTRYNGSNNGRVSLSLRQGADLLGMSNSTVQRALKELEEKGFIRRRTRGNWYGRKAAEFILTDCKFDGEPAGRDWQKWRPKKRRSVPRRTAKSISAPFENPAEESAHRLGTRRPNLKLVDGAA